MLATTVQLHDIDDVEGFVCGTIERSEVRLTTSEHEELVSEGVIILYDLARRFEPRRHGYAEEGRFSGFAAQFLPRRLGDVWHASNPNHRRLTRPDGSRVWHYDAPPVSLDAEDAPEVIAPGVTLEDLQEEMPRIREAIARMPAWQQLGIRRMVDLLLEGYGWDEIANRMSVGRDQIGKLREQLAGALLLKVVV